LRPLLQPPTCANYNCPAGQRLKDSPLELDFGIAVNDINCCVVVSAMKSSNAAKRLLHAFLTVLSCSTQAGMGIPSHLVLARGS
jgi:hypothetical protein